MANNITKNSISINVFGANVGSEECAAAANVLHQRWMGMGSQVQAFEQALAQHLGVPEVVLVNSGTSALALAVQLLRLPPGEIILPSFTFVGCAQAILLAGHRPRFADVDLQTHNLTAATVAAVLTPQTRAIMAVHYAGKVAPIDTFTFGLPIIEDAAHAIDSRIGPHACGTLGTVGIFSFDAVKNLATPDAGALVGPPTLLQQAREARYCGIAQSGFANRSRPRWWEHEIHHVAPKVLPNDMSAAIGLVQLQKLPQHQQRRRTIWRAYQERLKVIKPVEAASNEQHSYFTYLIRTQHRDDLAQYLLQQGVYTTLRFHPLHLNAFFNQQVSLPQTEQLNREGLNLPLHPALSDNDVDKIIELVNTWRKRHT